MLAAGTLLTIGLLADTLDGTRLLESIPLLIPLAGGYVGLLAVATITS